MERPASGFSGKQGHVFPQRGDMESLDDAASCHDVEKLGFCQNLDRDVLCILQAWFSKSFYIACNEAVRVIGMGTGVGGECHEVFPCSASVTGFFKQFPSGGLHGGTVLRFRDASAKFVVDAGECVAVLLFHDKASVACDSDHVDPVGIFQDMVGWDFFAVGEEYIFFPDGKPWFPVDVGTPQNLPFFKIILLHGELGRGSLKINVVRSDGTLLPRSEKDGLFDDIFVLCLEPVSIAIRTESRLLRNDGTTTFTYFEGGGIIDDERRHLFPRLLHGIRVTKQADLRKQAGLS